VAELVHQHFAAGDLVVLPVEAKVMAHTACSVLCFHILVLMPAHHGFSTRPTWFLHSACSTAMLQPR
jgi:hypothetical protein